MQDHVVKQQLIVSGAYWLECIMSVVFNVTDVSHQLYDLVWLSPLCIENKTHRIIFTIHLSSNDLEVNLSTLDKPNEQHLVRAIFKPNKQLPTVNAKLVSVETLKLQAKTNINIDTIYQEFSKLGFDYGQSYRIIRQLWCADKWSLSELDRYDEDESYIFNPGKVDAGLQTCLGISYVNMPSEKAHLPFSIKCIKSYQSMSKTKYIYTMLNSAVKNSSAYHLFFLDAQGQVLTFIQDFVGRRPYLK